MKNFLVAIYSVYDGEELLPYSVKQIRPHVDAVVCTYQTTSNRGEHYEPVFKMSLFDAVMQYKPRATWPASENEKEKRNVALQEAKKLFPKMTHFIFLDCDELYIPEEFAKAKVEVYELGVDASFCNIETYYSKPTLRLFPPETYFVPFICKYSNTSYLGHNRELWKRGIISDPTRTPVQVKNYRLLQNRMYHFSFVRKDISRKFRNSSSDKYAQNWRQLTEDFNNGKLVHFKGHELQECKNLFNIVIP